MEASMSLHHLEFFHMDHVPPYKLRKKAYYPIDLYPSGVSLAIPVSSLRPLRLVCVRLCDERLLC